MNNYDYIIIGSGAGGAAAAWRLATAGASVLLLEKGRELPLDGSTLDVERVIQRGEFKSHEPWQDRNGKAFAPEEYFNIGGKTRWYGAAVIRYAPHEFDADPAHQCPAWPVSHAEMTPYYDEAERHLGVTTFAVEPGLQKIIGRIDSAVSGWRSEPLPLALSTSIVDHPNEAAHFDAFASVRGLKADAERVFIDPVRGLPGFELRSGEAVTALLADAGEPRRVTGVITDGGREYYGRTVLLAAGALHSPRLLQGYLEQSGLDRELPAAANVGRNYKQHLLTALVGFGTARQHDLLRKTLLVLNEAMPHSSVQPLGFDAELIGTLMPGFVPRRLSTALGHYAYGFFLQTEDGSHPDNRVLAGGDDGLPMLDYDRRRIAPAAAEHRRLVRRFTRALLRVPMLGFSKTVPLAGTAHACGSLMMGEDPATSVVDAGGRVHGLENLYVVDGSVLPRSGRANPSLTIFAWALRVGDLLLKQTRGETHESAHENVAA